MLSESNNTTHHYTRDINSSHHIRLLCTPTNLKKEVGVNEQQQQQYYY